MTSRFRCLLLSRLPTADGRRPIALRCDGDYCASRRGLYTSEAHIQVCHPLCSRTKHYQVTQRDKRLPVMLIIALFGLLIQYFCRPDETVLPPLPIYFCADCLQRFAPLITPRRCPSFSHTYTPDSHDHWSRLQCFATSIHQHIPTVMAMEMIDKDRVLEKGAEPAVEILETSQVPVTKVSHPRLSTLITRDPRLTLPWQLWYRTVFFQATVVGTCAFLAPGLFNAMTITGGGGAQTPYLVNTASAILYACLTVVCIFGVGSRTTREAELMLTSSSNRGSGQISSDSDTRSLSEPAVTLSMRAVCTQMSSTVQNG